MFKPENPSQIKNDSGYVATIAFDPYQKPANPSKAHVYARGTILRKGNSSGVLGMFRKAGTWLKKHTGQDLDSAGQKAHLKTIIEGQRGSVSEEEIERRLNLLASRNEGSPIDSKPVAIDDDMKIKFENAKLGELTPRADDAGRVTDVTSSLERTKPSGSINSVDIELPLNDVNTADRKLTATEIDAAITRDLANLKRGTPKILRTKRNTLVTSGAKMSPDTHLANPTNWKRGIQTVNNNTENKRKGVLEKAGDAGIKLLSTFDKGADFLKKNVDVKTRVIAGLGLLATAGISMYTAPVFVTGAAISIVGAGMRLISASGTYITFRGVLEKMYEKKEKEGKAFNSLEKTLLGTSAVLGSAALGQAFGQIFEHFFPAEKIADVVHNASQVDTSGIPAHTPEVAPATSTSSVPTVLDVAPSPTFDFKHTVAKGDSLWSLLRADLTQSNFEGFNDLPNEDTKEQVLRKFIEKVNVPSGNKHLIRVGETLDFSKYFTK